jgi:hypothetical protein
MNSAANCWVEFVQSVAGEEKNPLTVLQAPEENGHQPVAHDILPDSLFQIYICLV